VSSVSLHEDDDALMARYLAGDAHAFEQLFRRLSPQVHGFFMRCFRDEAVADDLLQTTFFNVHRSRTTFDAGRATRPWVFTIAAHVRRDELRRRYRLKEDCDEEMLDEIEQTRGGEQATERESEAVADLASRVRSAIDKLPASQRAIIQFHRYEGLTFPQIAEILGSTPLAVRARAFRGYERLRVELADLVEPKSGHDAA
jgi:RNA polymerase sigma-70 factor (ECF subfamily)